MTEFLRQFQVIDFQNRTVTQYISEERIQEFVKSANKMKDLLNSASRGETKRFSMIEFCYLVFPHLKPQ